ncbi:putative ribonuclease H-like domain-containing protein [Tanacetum coccineum]
MKLITRMSAKVDKKRSNAINAQKVGSLCYGNYRKYWILKQGFGETFGSDEVFDLFAPSIFYTTPEDVAKKPLYDMFVKAVGMHIVPPPITGTFMPPSNNPNIDDTQFTYGSKSTNYVETNSVSNDYVFCDNSDKSSDSETTGFASCVSSIKSSSSKTNEHLTFTPNSVAFQKMSETIVQQPSSTNDDSSFSFKENVKPPRHLSNKSGINSRSFCKRKSFGSKTCFVCGSKFHLIKDCDFYEKQLELNNKPLWNNVTYIPSFAPKAASVPAGSRNRPTSVPAGSRHRPTYVPTGRPFSASWKNNAARPMTRPTSHYFQHFSRPGYYNHMDMTKGRWGTAENPHKNRDLGIVDSGCSRSMTGNKEKLVDFVKIVGGTVTFGGGDGKITGKGTIRTSKLDFENVYYVEELQTFNLFSVSQICDTKNKVLFTDKECLVLSKEFQLPDNSQVVLRVPRRNNLYCFNLTDIKPERDVTCLLAKASLVESTKWHRRMAHVNFKNMNKLAKHGLVNGLPSKLFTNEHNCVACNKGKQHKASYKAITAVSTISAPLQLLHMDLFGPTSIRSIDHKYYSLVVTDDFSRFTWVFFLGTKDETYGILKDFITFIENQLTKKVKAIRCDNGTEFKNSKLIELCGSKGIRRDYSNARTPQQNRVAERKNRTLIEAARTMLADSKLPTMFWTEAVSTACYVLNRVLVTKPHNKTPYELVSGKVPNISHLKPFGCLVTILNTSDYLGKFEGKADEGFVVGYAAHSKAYRVYNLSSKKIEETLNLRYLEDKPNVQGLGHEWYFDLDYLTDSLGYTRFKTNQPAGTQDTNIHAGTQDDSDSECDEQVIVVPSFPSNSFSGPKVTEASEMMESSSDYAEELARLQKQAYEANTIAKKNLSQADLATSRNGVPAGKIVSAADVSDGHSETSTPVCTPVHTATTSLPPGNSLGSSEHSSRYPSPSDLANTMSSSSKMEDIHHHPDTGIFSSSSYDDDFGGTVTNLAPSIVVDSVPTKRVNTIHPQSQILGDSLHCSVKKGEKDIEEVENLCKGFVSSVHDHKGTITQTIYILCTRRLNCLLIRSMTACPYTRWEMAIGTKWILKNKRDARVDYEFKLLIFLAFSHIWIYGISKDMKSVLFREIEEEGLCYQPRVFEDPHCTYACLQSCERLYRSPSSTKGLVYVDDIIFGSTNKAWCDEFEVLMKGEFEMSAMGELTFFLGLQVKQDPDEIFISQDKYVQDMLKKFVYGECETFNTPFEASKPNPRMNSIGSDYAGTHGVENQQLVDDNFLVLVNCSLSASEEGPSGYTGPPIDKTPYTIIESLVRSQLQLDGNGGVEELPIADIYLGFFQLILERELRNTKQYHAFKTNKQNVANMRLNFHGDTCHFGYMLPPAQAANCRSTQAPPEGTTSRGAEDLDKLTALSSLVSTLVQKVNTQESKLNAHKLMFKEVVGKLVKKEEDAEQDVDPLIKLAKAVYAAAASAVPTGGSPEADIPPSSYIHSDEFAGGSTVPTGGTTGPSADPSNKGKSPLLEEDPPVKERTFRQKEEDMLGEDAARRMYEEEQAELQRERAEKQRKRQ